MVEASKPVVIIDPTDEREPIKRSLAKRPEHISGTLGLLDISKPRGDKFIDRLEQLINEQMPEVTVKRYMKPTVSKPAPHDLRQKIMNECNFVIEAVADWGSCTTCSVHDAVWFESNNMPAVFVATDEFVDSAVAQSTSLGLPEVPRVYIPHPMQDQTDEEMWAKAEEALDKLLAALVK